MLIPWEIWRDNFMQDAPVVIMEEAPYQSSEVTIDIGAWLAAFTDGVIEAEKAHLQAYDEERFFTTLHSGVMLTPASLLNSVLIDLDRFVGAAPQHDDVTCVLLRAT